MLSNILHSMDHEIFNLDGLSVGLSIISPSELARSWLMDRGNPRSRSRSRADAASVPVPALTVLQNPRAWLDPFFAPTPSHIPT